MVATVPNQSIPSYRRRRWRVVRALLALVVSVLLVVGLQGCSPKWRAPVESRTMTAYPAAAKRPDSYRVRHGDSLAVIAWRWGLDWRSLASWNRIREPYTIYPGQRLRLKPPTQRTARPSHPSAPARPRSKPKDGTAIASGPPAKPATVARPVKRPVAPPSRAKAKPSGFVSAPRWRWPVDGKLLSTYRAADETRKGIKIGGRKGNSIAAAEAGKVVYSGSGLIGYGRLIIIKHNNEYLSAYGHNRRLLVNEGDWVAKGDKIAEMGLANKGQAMLHFEIRHNGKPVNPVALLPRRAG